MADPTSTSEPSGGAAATRVAVIVTAYQKARWLDRAIRSCVEQDHPALEVIVVDDGSTDDPATVVAGHPGVRFVRKDNGGPSSARNAGIRATTAELVVFVDGDDWLLPGAVAANVAAFGTTPRPGMVAGGYVDWWESDSPEPDLSRVSTAFGAGPTPVSHRGFADLLRHGNHIGMLGAVMFDRAALVASGGWDDATRACEDYDVYLRMARDHLVAYHDRPLAVYRRHDTNLSLDSPLMLQTGIRVLRRQREACAGDPVLRRALDDGLATMRSWYGWSTVAAIGPAVRERRWRDAGRATIAGMRYAPRLVAGRLLGRARRVAPQMLGRR
ncbi:MAG: glycosyltransferase family A protein [Acidimicrobiales bacterium]